MLLQCPYCGSEAEHTIHSDAGDEWRCRQCNAWWEKLHRCDAVAFSVGRPLDYGVTGYLAAIEENQLKTYDTIFTENRKETP